MLNPDLTLDFVEALLEHGEAAIQLSRRIAFEARAVRLRAEEVRAEVVTDRVVRDLGED